MKKPVSQTVLSNIWLDLYKDRISGKEAQQKIAEFYQNNNDLSTNKALLRSLLNTEEKKQIQTDGDLDIWYFSNYIKPFDLAIRDIVASQNLKPTRINLIPRRLRPKNRRPAEPLRWKGNADDLEYFFKCIRGEYQFVKQIHYEAFACHFMVAESLENNTQLLGALNPFQTIFSRGDLTVLAIRMEDLGLVDNTPEEIYRHFLLQDGGFMTYPSAAAKVAADLENFNSLHKKEIEDILNRVRARGNIKLSV